jgi:hypothetical protein
MAIVRWRGDAPAVNQESRATPANVEVGDIFELSINGKTVRYAAAAATVADVTAGLTAAWNASTVPEHAEITASDQTTHVRLIADKPGVPFTISANTVDGGGNNNQTLTVTTPVAASGPNDWNTAANWSTGSVPAAGDDVYVENTASSILYGINQTGLTLASLNVAQSFTGAIGLPTNNAGGYVEYRDQYLVIGAGRVVIGQGDGPGSGRIKLDTGAGPTTLDLVNSGNPSDLAGFAVHWKGTHASNVINVSKGSLGIAVEADQAATVNVLRVGYRNSVIGDATVYCGSGTMLTTLEQSGGQVTLTSGVATVDKTAGELTMLDGAITTLRLDGGWVHYQSTGAIGAAIVGQQGSLDFSRDMRPRTVTACDLYGGGRILDPFKTVTFTSGIRLVRAALGSVALDVGVDRTLLLS